MDSHWRNEERCYECYYVCHSCKLIIIINNNIPTDTNRQCKCKKNECENNQNYCVNVYEEPLFGFFSYYHCCSTHHWVEWMNIPKCIGITFSDGKWIKQFDKPKKILHSENNTDCTNYSINLYLKKDDENILFSSSSEQKHIEKNDFEYWIDQINNKIQKLQSKLDALIKFRDEC